MVEGQRDTLDAVVVAIAKLSGSAGEHTLAVAHEVNITPVEKARLAPVRVTH